jgi:hypothetical protein
MNPTLTPAYGRDYKSKKAVLADWLANKDFILQQFGSPYDGKPFNRDSARDAGFDAVNIRYKRNTQITVVKVGG